MPDKFHAQLRHALRIPILLERENAQEQIVIRRQQIRAARTRRPDLRRDELDDLRIPFRERIVADVFLDRVPEAQVEAAVIHADDDVRFAFDGEREQLVEQPPELEIILQHSGIGISDVLKNYFKFRGLFNHLLALAIERKPDVVIGVDYGGFNLRFGHAGKEYVRNNPFSKWNPKIVQFVSPQVWASRPGRANLLAADYDLLLSIFPFEKDWYAQRVPKLRVEFVGHPMVERLKSELKIQNKNSVPTILLLPGSRKSELQRHLPVMLGALKAIQEKLPSTKAK